MYMRNLIAAAALAAGALSVTACGSSSPPPAAAAPAATAAATAPASAPVTLGPLKLASFPPTAAGTEARSVCRAWQGLRREYASRLSSDSPYKLNQWFSSAAWHKSWEDAAALGNDPAYAQLEVAYGTATVGDMAGAGTAREMDKACAKGD